MEEYRTRFITIDWISRGISVISLAIAGWAGWQLYSKSMTPSPPIGDVEQVHKYIDDQLNQKLTIQLGTKFEDHERRIDNRLKDSDDQLRAGLKKFADVSKDEIDTLREHEKQDRERRDKEFQTFVANLPDIGVKPESSTNETVAAAEVGGDKDLAAEKDKSILKIAQLRLRPTDDLSSPHTSIRLFNEGQSSAVVNRIEFTPKKDFPVPKANPEPPLNSDITTVVFEASHNTATEKGAHSTYRYYLKKPIELAPNEELNLRLRIANADHEGFGFTGPANLYYDDGKVLSVPDVQVVFHKPDARKNP